MSKELEMLHDFVKWNEDFKSLQFNVKGYGNGRNVEQAHQELIELEKLLTPPTAEDICKELEEYFYRCVGKACPCLKYEKDTKKFVYIDGLTEDVYELVTLEKHGYIHFGTSLPPHLVEMIGKFYKGKVKE